MFIKSFRKFSKLAKSAAEAIKPIRSNMTILGGGFGVCGVANSLMLTITKRPDIKNLTFVSNNAGIDGHGIGNILSSGQVKRMISSYVGENKTFQNLYLSGKLEVELTPQGTLAEKIRCGGAGIPLFATKTGTNTLVEHGGIVIKYDKNGKSEILSQPKKTYIDERNNTKYLLEKSLRGDVALIKAWKGDKYGNLIYRYAAQNFNQDMAKAADYVIAEIEELVDEIDPNHVHTPCIFVDSIVISEDKTKPIERKCNTENMDFTHLAKTDKKHLLRYKIAKRAAKEIDKSCSINLGIGIPTMVPSFISHELEIFLQSENGILGVSGFPEPGKEDGDLVDAAKQSVVVRDGASFFSASESFGIIRGAHLAYTMLGGMEVSSTGDLSNWIIPGKMVKGMGGAMDLVSSGSKVFVLMEHTSNGQSKILSECNLPLTGKGVVNKIFTELAVFDVLPNNEGLLLTDIAEESSLEEVTKLTGCGFKIADIIDRF